VGYSKGVEPEMKMVPFLLPEKLGEVKGKGSALSSSNEIGGQNVVLLLFIL